MEENLKICSECNTENEEKYEFCKNCGAPLLSVEKEKFNFNSNQPEGFTPPFENATYNDAYNTNQGFNPAPPPVYSNVFTETIEGLPYSDYAIFVGKKGDKYMPVFSKLEITSSKVAWHWPAALLGFFLGPLGAAIWFFYRKIYKPALLLTAIGVILLIINGIIMAPAVSGLLGEFNNEGLISAIVSGDILEKAEAALSKETAIIELISDFSTLITGILCGLFAHHIYKRHIHKTIIRYRQTHTDARYYQMALSSLGGTSDGMLVLGIILNFFSSSIEVLICLLFYLLF